MQNKTPLISLLLVLSIPNALALELASKFLDPIYYIKLTAILLVIITMFMMTLGKNIVSNNKKTFFWLMTIPVLLSTLYVSGFTLYENAISVTKGPIHWHADYKVLVCGERLDLINPKFPKNKIGSPLFHEHNDDRIHIEGTVHKLEDVNLGAYFRVIGGSLTSTSLSYPTTEKFVSISNGDLCNNQPSILKVYVNGKRISDPENHLIYPVPYVPNGDCIIIDFSPGSSDTTNEICESWQVKEVTYDNVQREQKTIGDKTWQ